MVGVPIEGPSVLLGDNLSVVSSASIPSSTLKKKHTKIAYHSVREANAANIIVMGHVNSKDNLADVLTKPVSGPINHKLINPILFKSEASIA